MKLEMRSLVRPPWKHTLTAKPHPSPLPAMAIILRRGSATVPAAADIDLWNRTAEEIADWMIAADPEKAGKVCMALLERSSASSMAILYFPGHCIGSPA